MVGDQLTGASRDTSWGFVVRAQGMRGKIHGLITQLRSDA